MDRQTGALPALRPRLMKRHRTLFVLCSQYVLFAGLGNGPFQRFTEALPEPSILGVLALTFADLVMIERRKAQRRRTLKTGSLIFKNGGGVSCMVRNISAGGACLEVTDSLKIPDAFTLVVESDNILRRCQIGWRSKNRIGVAFN
jgi:hypothetical protein